jgi:hypothetical protein
MGTGETQLWRDGRRKIPASGGRVVLTFVFVRETKNKF